MKTLNPIYKTEDGRIFDDENQAVINDNIYQFNKYGEFGHYGFILRSWDNGITWVQEVYK